MDYTYSMVSSVTTETAASTAATSTIMMMTTTMTKKVTTITYCINWTSKQSKNILFITEQNWVTLIWILLQGKTVILLLFNKHFIVSLTYCPGIFTSIYIYIYIYILDVDT